MKIPFRNPAVSIDKRAYSMASADGTSAEITLYGDIYESQPVDWWGNPVEGQFILLDEFLEDLEQIKECRSITVRINSYGGDAGVSNTIHNRLRELARNGAELTCVVDGVAMSGGSLIMCACDTVRANPSSLIMVHKAWSFLWGGYNADELRKTAVQMDAWDRMQSEIYQRKTGLSNAVVLHLMSDTTYMTGREAKEKGFVDELLDDAEPVAVAASADGRSLFVRGREMHLAPGMFAPDSIPTVTPEANAPVTDTNLPAETGEEGGNPMTLEELRAQYPDLVAQIETAAAAAADHSAAVQAAIRTERERLSQIDEVAGLFDPALVTEAKYGETACTAADLALRAAQAAARQGAQFLTGLASDAAASGANDVGAAPGGADDEKPLTDAEKMAEGEAMAKKLRGKEKEE